MHQLKPLALRALAVLVVVVVLPATALGQSKAAEITQKTWEGLQAGTVGLEDGLKELDKAIEEDESYAPAWFYRGFVFANLQRMQEAHESFLMAAELNPGWGPAHNMTAISARDTGKLDVAWEHAIKAHQSGMDMAEMFQGLQTMGRSPDDLEDQLAAKRVFVAPINTEKFEQQVVNPFTSGSASDATGRGQSILSQAQADLFRLLYQTRKSLANSRAFGLVQRQDMADYVLVIEVDNIGGNPSRRPLRGYIRLLDSRSGEEAYRRPLQLRNIASLGDLNGDLERYVNFLEVWAAEVAR